MKKSILIVLVFTLVLLSACGAKQPPVPTPTAAPAPTATPEPPAPAPEATETVSDPIDPNAFIGAWVCDRAILEIARSGEDYKCYIHWGSSAWESTCWDYDCMFDGEALYSFETGVRSDVTYSQDGSSCEVETVFDDGAARFELLDSGRVKWTDYKEYPGGGEYEFERLDLSDTTPTAEDFVNDFYTMVAGYHPGVAGASLNKARIATEAVRFAAEHNLWCADVSAMREAVQKGRESLTAAQREDFDAAIDTVADLIDSCMQDWESNRGLFEDAGAEMEMDALVRDPMARIAWPVLYDAVASVK